MATALLAVLPLSGCFAQSVEEPRHSASAGSTPSPMSPSPPMDRSEAFGVLEESYSARLGVYAIDTATGVEIAHRGDERFAFASTIKVLLAAVLLDNRSDAELEQTLPIRSTSFEYWSPITEQHAGGTMTLRRLAEAAARYSDNTAANMLFEALGGPPAVETELRALGDEVTEVERLEPGLNEAVPGDPRDTSTPRAFAQTLRAYAVDDGLSQTDRAVLIEWMRGNTTGDALIRAGVPDGWIVGDRTGNAAYGTRNDVGVLWPEEGAAPIVLVVMSSKTDRDAEHDDRLIAEATSIVVDAIR